ncbi:MAG: efflux RND transporter periplasmic adaptor subunit [Bdellovibrionales bacterium]|nr:efflux RND transporter periplasmic adaptor subunit [Bdellovibrionales bacterium]
MSCDSNYLKQLVGKKHKSDLKHSVTKKKSDVKSYYTCSMHPHIKKHKPGKCPICNMRLTKILIDNESLSKKENNKITSAADSLKYTAVKKIKLKKSQLKHFRAEIFTVTKMLMTKKIYLLGSIIQSEETESKITARVSGRVEKVYIKSTGSLIKKDSPILELYSPKLITAGEEYLIARRSYNNAKTKIFKNMLRQSVQRLKLWGIKSFQYKKWFKQGRVPKKITIYSPSAGIVKKRNAIVGKYFKEGQNFFELSDLSDVWVEMDIYEHDSSLVEIGQKIKLQFTALPGENINGEIDFINPVLNSVSRTLKIRSTISNPDGKLKPGMVANATLSIVKKTPSLVVPKTAIIDTGKKKIVWVQISNANYSAKIINTGYESGGYTEIKKGLLLGEKVVTDGNFLLDAQSQFFKDYD